MTEDETYEHTIYGFVDGGTEGYVDISSKQTILHFPELKEALSSVPCQECNLYLDKQLILSYKWLPFYSQNDCSKIMDMLFKCYSSFQHTFVPYAPSPYRAYNKLITNINVSHYNIYILEEGCSTSVQITNNKKPNDSQPSSITSIFRIYIGRFLLFCSERDLSGLSKEDTIYIIQLILYKFTTS
jgi:hypothetical protein